MKAIIPAAGLGTRFLPATKSVPKELLPLGTKPAIQWVVEEALAAGADEAVVVTSPRKEALRDYFSPDPALEAELRARGKKALANAVLGAGSLPVTFVEQTEQLGLGHALRCCAGLTGDEPFYVLLADIVVPRGGLLERMAAVSAAHGGASVICAMRLPWEQVVRSGVIDGEPAGDGMWRVRGLVEKPSREEAPSDLTIFGHYLLSPRVMGLLAETAPGAGGEVQLTDAIQAVLAEEEVWAVEVSPEEGYDLGTPETWAAANAMLSGIGGSNGR